MAPRGPHEAQPPEKSRPHLRNDEVQTPCCDRSIDRSIPGILNDTGDDDGTRRNHHTARVVGFFQSHEGHDGEEVAGRAPNHRLAERARAGLPAESSDTTGGRRDVDVDVDRFRLGRYGDLQAAADDVLAGRHSARHSHVPGASLSELLPELLPELLSESLPLSLLLGYRRAMPTARSLGGLRRSFLSLSLSLSFRTLPTVATGRGSGSSPRRPSGSCRRSVSLVWRSMLCSGSPRPRYRWIGESATGG